MISSSSMTGKEGPDWIYLSPHLDDAALSCAGLIWEQTQTGLSVSIWTICAGDPPDAPLSPFAEALHQRWQTGTDAAAERRQEDIRSCQRLGASFRHFSLPDCIYRMAPGGNGYLYDSEEAIFGSIHPMEAALVEKLSIDIAAQLPEGAVLVSPLALGGHVDHRLTRSAAERLPHLLLYYPDFPYLLQNQPALDQLLQAGWISRVYPVSSAGLQAWQDAIAAHASQISTFWPDLNAMRAAIKAYQEQSAGILLMAKGNHPLGSVTRE